MANKKLSATISIGGAVSSSLKSAFGNIKGQVGQVGSALRRLENEQKTLTKAIETFGKQGRNVDGLRQRYAALTSDIDRLAKSYKQLGRIQAAQQQNLAKRAELRGQMVDAVALGATAAAPLVLAAKFETAMLGVAKQVDGARDANGKLTAVYYDMGKQIQMLGREIPLATNELADMVTAGARMGIAKDQLLDFTRTAAMMADAFEMPAGELADSMGKIANLFKIPIPAIGELADSINYLDDNAISKGGDIIDFLTRTGGVASAVKVTGQEMAALGSTLLTLGERAETASTATNAMFQKFAAADKGTKKFKAAMAEIGLSTREVQRGMQKDATGTMMKVMDAIGKLPAEKQLGVMVELVGLEHSDTLAKLANNTAEWRRQLELANGAAAKGSMSREFQARLQTTNAQWQIMKNRVEEVGVNFGSILLPAVNDTFGAFAPLISTVADFARENPKVTKAVVGTVVALTTLKLGALAAGYGFTFMKGGALTVARVLAGTRAQIILSTVSTKALGVAAGVTNGGLVGMATRGAPLAAAAIRAVGAAFISTGIGALVTGLALGALYIYRNWDGVKAFFVGTLEGIKSGLSPLTDSFNTFLGVLKPLQPVFDSIGNGVKFAFEWFSKLLEPVNYSSEELKKAGDAGRSFGEALAAGINIVTAPLQWLMDSITWVSNNIGGALDKAVEFKSYAQEKIGGAIDKTKSFFGMESGSPSAPPMSAPALPVPAMATSGGTGGSFTDNSQNVYQIVQQPGESNRDLAKRIAEEQERRKAVKQRSLMTDGVTAQ